jgi:hypothetical protein
MQLLQHAGGLNVEGEADSWDFGVGMYNMFGFTVKKIDFE